MLPHLSQAATTDIHNRHKPKCPVSAFARAYFLVFYSRPSSLSLPPAYCLLSPAFLLWNGLPPLFLHESAAHIHSELSNLDFHGLFRLLTAHSTPL